jgi:hypothetical protein
MFSTDDAVSKINAVLEIIGTKWLMTESPKFYPDKTSKYVDRWKNRGTAKGI